LKKSPWSGGEGDVVVVVAAALPNDDGDVVSEDGAAKSLLLNSILFVTKVFPIFYASQKKKRVK